MKIRRTVVLLVAMKVGFMVLCVNLFSMRCLIGVGKDWLLDTTSTQDIIKELHMKKYSSAVLDSFNADGKTGLMIAVGRADLDLVKAFVNAGADINVHAADHVGDTALHIACASGHINVVKLLLDEEADIAHIDAVSYAVDQYDTIRFFLFSLFCTYLDHYVRVHNDVYN